jgi:hypothetical protein
VSIDFATFNYRGYFKNIICGLSVVTKRTIISDPFSLQKFKLMSAL